MSYLKTVKLNRGKITVKDLEKNSKTPERFCTQIISQVLVPLSQNKNGN